MLPVRSSVGSVTYECRQGKGSFLVVRSSYTSKVKMISMEAQEDRQRGGTSYYGVHRGASAAD